MTDEWIPLSVPDIGEEEIDAVATVIRRRWLTMGEETANFESEFADFVDAKHAVAVSNCTVALHLALLAMDVKAGDEVIVPSLSFAATANAVLYCGAAPVFADICGPHSLNIDPEDVRSKITEKTRGIIPVHHSGYSADMTAIRQISQEHGLFVIEDAAQAAGSSGPAGTCGSVGDASCFSFYSTKNMTTAEGGMLTTNSDEIAEKARLLRSHAITASVLERDTGKKFGYDIIDLGYNYRMDEIRASIGRVQLRRLKAGNERRAELTGLYHQRLGESGSYDLPFVATDGTSSCHLLPVLLPPGIDRDGIANAMRERKIQTSVHYKPIHLLDYYRRVHGTTENSLPRTEQAAGRELTMPLFASMSDAQVDRVCSVLDECCDKYS